MQLYQDDCLNIMHNMPSDSVDSLITDPPAGISFMGKSWDSGNNFIPAMTEIFKECLRVLKPGAHGLVWALPRTSHWTATALEQAGFEIRDVITHLFGSGFPKSHNLGEGRGTALKPASEHWILVRKPCSEKTVAANVLKHGTGGINIDACRIEAIDQDKFAKNWDRELITDIRGNKYNAGTPSGIENNSSAPQGRFPANIVFDEDAAKMLDEQSGQLHLRGNKKETTCGGGMYGHEEFKGIGLSESGYAGASRFFYVAKASKKDRNEGLDGMPEHVRERHWAQSEGRKDAGKQESSFPQANNHPTVKSTKLMEYLITLITPVGGTVLDPFMGSGSTGKAAKRLGFNFIGIEKEKEYFEIAQKRCTHYAV